MTCGLLPSSMLSRPFFDREKGGGRMGDWKMNFRSEERGLGWQGNWVYYLAILFPDQMSYFVGDFGSRLS